VPTATPMPTDTATPRPTSALVPPVPAPAALPPPTPAPARPPAPLQVIEREVVVTATPSPACAQTGAFGRHVRGRRCKDVTAYAREVRCSL
jgi:hypothetical protein